MLNHGSMRIILFVAFALTGCTVAAGSRTSAPITSSYSAASISPTRIGGPTDRFRGIRRSVTCGIRIPRSRIVKRKGYWQQLTIAPDKINAGL